MNSLRLLLVDGGSEKAKAISSTLARANYTVLPASGLDEAGEALFVERFDVVLLAGRFPAKSLADFSAKVRRVEQNRSGPRRIPVLALESEPVEACDGYVHEPIDPVKLTEDVQRLAAALGKPVGMKGANANEELPVLEAEKFEEQVGYDNDLMVEIIGLFLEERRAQISGMQQSIAARDWESLSKIAHTIKGSLGSLHATRARATAQELETAARKGDAEHSLAAHRQLVRDLDALEPRLLELRESVTSAS